MIPIPNSRPKATRETVITAATARWVKDHPGVALPDRFVLGVRAYYDQTIAPTGNNLNAYDDAFFIVTPNGMTSWNGNTDPARYGWNSKAGKNMARLRVGCWKFISRMHRGKYQAFGQGDNTVSVDRVRRDGTVEKIDTGNNFGIDLHLGGENGVSSEGCCTVPPSQWNDFRRAVNSLLSGGQLREFDFILTDGPIN